MPDLRHFDPYPFSLLGTLVAIEGILLASFILMRQSRTARRSNEQDHLILPILILSQREITATLRIQQQLAVRSDLTHSAQDQETEALAQQTLIDEIAQTMRDHLLVE